MVQERDVIDITAPGRIAIQSGEDGQEAEDTLFINAFNGNICYYCI
jgi:hypothetical protein